MAREVREISRPQGRKAPRPQKEFVFCSNGPGKRSLEAHSGAYVEKKCRAAEMMTLGS